jgi:hypothetical protein
MLDAIPGLRREASAVDLTFAAREPEAPKRMSNPKLHQKPYVCWWSFGSGIRKE